MMPPCDWHIPQQLWEAAWQICSGLPISSEARRLSLIQRLAKNVNVLQIMREECFLTCNTQASLTPQIDPGFQYPNSGTHFSLHSPRTQICHREVRKDREELEPPFCQRHKLNSSLPVPQLLSADSAQAPVFWLLGLSAVKIL